MAQIVVIAGAGAPGPSAGYFDAKATHSITGLEAGLAAVIACQAARFGLARFDLARFGLECAARVTA